MGNSPLVSLTKISPYKTSPRNRAIDTISIHCMAGGLSVETCGEIFQRKGRDASSNYGIGSDGRIALYVDEADRSWCTSSASNDHRAITIEVANNGGEPIWPVSDKVYASLILLLTDICKRNNIKELLWKADKSLIGQVDKQNMTIHRWFAKTACPGEYLYSRHADIANAVNRNLKFEEDDEMPDFSKLSDAEIDQLLSRINKRLAILPVSNYAKEPCQKAVKSGIFSDGDKDGSVDNPQGFLRRQEIAALFDRLGFFN